MATQSWLKHSQLLFWDAEHEASVTVDVNGDRGHVFEAPMKEFSRRGWTFVRLRVTADEEMRALAYLRRQINKKMNTGTTWFACGGSAKSGNEETFFCSELVVRTLQHLGYMHDVRAETMSPGSLFDYLITENRESAKQLRAHVDGQHVVRHRQFWADFERTTDQMAYEAEMRRRPPLLRTRR